MLVVDGRIKAAGKAALNQGAPEGAEIVDCAGKAVLPGLVDARVFIGEPGGEHRETIASASLAAAAGGVTSIVMMPDTDPVIDNVALVEFILRTARDTALVNVYPAAAITKGFEGREMTEFGLLREAGAVALTEGRHTIASPLVMRRALTYARDFGAVIAHETEDSDLAAGGVMNEGLYASWLGLAGIPREAETIPLERDLSLARLTGGAYHAAKISTAQSVAAIARAKADGANVTAGVSINNLSLNDNDVGEYRTFFRLAPPLRAEDDRLAMIEALQDGTIDIIVSSHDPQDVDTKRLPFADAAAGAIGLETLLGAALRLHHNGDVPLLAAGRGAVERAGKTVRPARRNAGAGRERRPRPRRSRRTLGGARGRHPLALEEHLLRGRAAAGQGLANDGCGPHSIFGSFSLTSGGSMLQILAALVFGYLLGSIPFGLLITRAAGLGDVRKIGSGNIGATNVLRTGNKGLAALTLLADVLKGTVAVLIAGWFSPELGLYAGFAAFLGHIFPAWLSFKGGKGVATYLGVLLGVYWPAALAFARRMAGRRLPDALLVARRPDRRAGRAGVSLLPRPRQRGRLVRDHDGDRLLQALGQHLAADGRNGSAHRGEGMSKARRGAAPQRPPAHPLAPPDPHRKCRAGDVPRPDQPLRIGRDRARNAAGAGDLRRRQEAAAHPDAGRSRGRARDRREAWRAPDGDRRGRTIRRCCGAWTRRRRSSR